jgi:hypothetical protein
MRAAALVLLLFSGTAMAQDFHGYPCTQDCSGHEAGYAWADRKGIDDADDCGGKSNSFIEGCRAYVEEQEASQDEERLSDDEESLAE